MLQLMLKKAINAHIQKAQEGPVTLYENWLTAAACKLHFRCSNRYIIGFAAGAAEGPRCASA
jgi:hypothetical protein